MIEKARISRLVVRSVCVFLIIMVASVFGQPRVKIWEEPVVIPTYLTGDPDPNPMFYTGRAYQGAKGPVYPYPMLDKLTDNQVDKSYNAVYLENEYIKLCVLPEIGGRIFYATDKTNGYEMFYRQHVIKPALIGMLGAWISGGVEWCIPHHHRATTFMPVDYTLEEHPDGSATVWVGEMELRHRTKWIIGLTLYPDKSIIEATVRLFNRTPFVHSFLYWANVAVHTNEDYQILFPPCTQFATFHGKNQFTEWPVSHQFYNGVDYTEGVDISWWKNLPSPTSLFAWNDEDDFLAGYDHGKEAGLCHVADHHIVPGKKLWAWGTGSTGQAWEKILTETDGPYIELMVGAYSDNQPDYSWIQPYEVKTFRQVWYPLRKIGGVENANERAAVNLIVEDGSARFGFNATEMVRDARVILRTGEQSLFEERIDIDPRTPYWNEVSLPSGIDRGALKVSLSTSDGEELIRFRPVDRAEASLPEPVQPPSDPKKIETVEELYFAGQRLEQFYNPVLNPHPYYEEALKRDSNDVRTNTAMGIDCLKRGMFQKAEAYLQRAVARASANYTRLRDGEALYYLGAALRAQEKTHEAYDAFSNAAWDATFHSAAYCQLAELDCLEGNYELAIDHLWRSLTMNAVNTKALTLRCVVLRHLGRLQEAEMLAAKALDLDPLDFWAAYERFLLLSGMGSKSEADASLHLLKKRMRHEVQSYLELATDYSNAGFWREAIDVLMMFEEGTHRNHPLVLYMLSTCWDKLGDEAASRLYGQKAGEASPEYCFPFRLEMMGVLRHAMQKNPKDARAPYYLGNLLYDIQPEEATKSWEASMRLDGRYAGVYRNLAFAYARIENDIPKAVVAMEKAVQLNQNDPRFFYELDLLYEMAGVSTERRLALLQKHHRTVVQRDDAFSREILLLVQAGKYDRAIDFLTTHHFHLWEGGGRIHQVYVDACLLRGIERLKARKYSMAREDFRAALVYPENLEVGRPQVDVRAYKTYYLLGWVCEVMGQSAEAREYYLKAADSTTTVGWSDILYFQGMALRKLGRLEDAAELFDRLIEGTEQRLQKQTDVDFFVKFGEKQSEEKRIAQAHTLAGLGYLGKDDEMRALSHFKEARRLDTDQIWARMDLYR